MLRVPNRKLITQKNSLDEKVLLGTQNILLKIMGKKIFTISRSKISQYACRVKSPVLHTVKITVLGTIKDRTTFFPFRKHIRNALNQQTAIQFKQYSEQQFPGNPQQVCITGFIYTHAK